MKRIVIFAAFGWSIERVYNDMGATLKEEYEFVYHNAKHFYMHKLQSDLKEAVCLIAPLYFYPEVMKYFKTPADWRKLVFMSHGHEEIYKIDYSEYPTYCVTSDVLLPFMPMKALVTPNGVRDDAFTRIRHSGKLATLGWCASKALAVKRFDWSYKIADLANLPISVASKLPFEELKKWYHTLDLLLVTSGPGAHAETGPLPPFEAIMSGIPVIGTAVGNFRTVPGPKFSTIEEAVAILKGFQAHPEQLQRLADEQYTHVMENYTYAAVKKQWVALLEVVAEKQKEISVWDPIVCVDSTKATPLCEIMGRHGSDKGSAAIETCEHNYTTVYHRLLEMKRNLPMRVFELGLGTNFTDVPSNMGATGKPGASLRGWAEYFQRAAVFGADIDTRVLFQEERIKTFACDQTKPESIRTLWETPDLEEGFDLIVEDGLHQYDANVCFFENSIHKVKPDGYFIIEDIFYTKVPKFHTKIEEWKSRYPSFAFRLVQIPSKVNKTNNRILIAHNTASANLYSTIDACLYINLAHREDRRKHIETQLALAKIPSENLHRIDAVYKKGFGILGCVESHIRALELAGTRPEWEWVAIFEDDFTFREPAGFQEKIASILQNAKPDVLMLAQGNEELSVSPTRRSDVMKIKAAKTTSGYIVHNSYIPTLLLNFQESRDLLATAGKFIKEYCLDTYWSRIQEEGQWYAFSPSIGYQCVSHSDIVGGVMDYKC